MDPTLVVADTATGDYRITHNASLRFALDVDDIRSELDVGAEVLQTGLPVRRPGGTLFSLKNNKPRRNMGGNAGGRSYDYEEKYPADDWGAELSSEARFYKTYVDESEVYDLDRIEAWRDALDVLLVFIGLFSAIVTTFVIQTSLSLQPDYGQITAAMMYNLILVQQSFANGSPTAFPTIQNPTDIPANHTQLDVWINALWFTSLGISLSTALITVLTKQWLYRYMSPTSGTSQERARVRQFRLAGLEKYRVPMIIDLLPVALHIALGLFLVGLALFLTTLQSTTSIVVSAVAGVAYVAYLISAVLPLFDPQCPYQSPISKYIYGLQSIVGTSSRSLRLWVLDRSVACIEKLTRLGYLATTTNTCLLPLKSEITRLLSVPPPAPSVRGKESQVVSQTGDQLDVDAITWLYSTSSNLTVRKISFQAVVGLQPSPTDTSLLVDVITPYFEEVSRGLTEYGNYIIPGREGEYYRLMQAACINDFPVSEKYADKDVLELEEKDGRRVFNHLVLPVVTRPGGWDDIDLMCFLSPGSRSHVRLPSSIWRLWIVKGIQPNVEELDREMLDRLLSVQLTKTGNAANGQVTFADALCAMPHLQRLILDILVPYLDVQRPQVSSFSSSSFLLAIQDWALPRWEEDPLTTLRLLASCFKAYRRDPIEANTMVDILHTWARFFAHELAFDHEEPNRSSLAWTAYAAAAETLCSLWVRGVECPPGLLRSLIVHLGRPAPSTASLQDVEKVVAASQYIINAASSAGLEIVYQSLCELDSIPLAFATSGHDATCRTVFWDYTISSMAIFQGQNPVRVNPQSPAAVEWMRYIDCPQRLSFLWKRLGLGDEYWDEDEALSFQARVEPLIVLTQHSQHWAACFGALVGLLDDNDYMESILHCDEPHRELSNTLVHMQEVLTVDLSMFSIPRYDEDDNLIIGQEGEVGGPERLLDTSNRDGEVEDLQGSLPAAWNTVQANGPAFSSGSLPIHSPRLLEEARIAGEV